MKSESEQRGLFELPEPELAAAPARAEHVTLARALPQGLRLGGMTWSYPDWKGTVYALDLPAKQLTPKNLADHGLTAYSKHPLLRVVEIDRSYYEPLEAEVYERYHSQVPEDFKFVVKAHEDCVVARYPAHARYGKKAGTLNARYLDPAYATDAVIGPLAALGQKLGALLFQFPPQAVEARRFAAELHDFLDRLPKGPRYAVELRNAELLTGLYSSALADAGAVHCHTVWTGMPSVLTQARIIAPEARRPLLVRWLLRRGLKYEAANARYKSFDRLADEDPENRSEIARLVTKASQHGVPAIVLVDNKAEGCAPESIDRLARAIVERADRERSG